MAVKWRKINTLTTLEIDQDTIFSITGNECNSRDSKPNDRDDELEDERAGDDDEVA